MFHEGFRSHNLKLDFQPTNRPHKSQDAWCHADDAKHKFPYDQTRRIVQIAEAREDAEVTERVNALEGNGK